jgi:hypothetical protein
MSLKLEDLLTKFKDINNFEFEGRKFMTNVKSVALKAYLHIIFSAANEDIQRNIIEPLNLPASLRDFYRHYNGAHLFIDTLSIYGFRPRNYLIDRSDWRKHLPYDFVDANAQHLDIVKSSAIVLVGSYGYDRSRVYVERASGKVFCCVEDNFKRIRASWASFEDWIQQEILRLSHCYDAEGNLLVSLELTLPDAFKKFKV